MKDILTIVVTGGPCGGKTTVLEELTELLRGYGYTVYLVSESATELINDGVRPFGEHKLDIYDFQGVLFDLQLAKENIRKHAAKVCSNSKVAILCDRGIMDNRGYISDELFEQLMKERNISEAEILMRYDMVIHLVTAAIGREEYYTTANNTARTETIEEARILDRKTLEAWRNHPNLRIVNNDTLFDEKILKVKNFIRSYIGLDEVIKEERYLIDLLDIKSEYFYHNLIREDINEFVLSYDNDMIQLYRKCVINGNSYYTCVKRNKILNTKTCRAITKEEYDEYKSKNRGNILNKIRYNFIDEGERFRLDIYDIDGEKMAILERDVVNNKRESLPLFIGNRIDITNNRDYDDDSIYIDYNINKIYSKKKALN